MFKIIVFVPVESKEIVKNALFDAGAGVQGAYDRCSFETLGTGQFRPLAGSNPTIGTHNQIENVAEARVEMLCPPGALVAAIKALKLVHPYEEPAYDIIRLIAPGEYF